MRNKDYIAEHRGGLLSKSHHSLLARWAADCAEHVLSIFSDVSADTRPRDAIRAAREWSEGRISVGDSRNAALAAHEAAREIKDKSMAACEVARSAGHAAATAHMADHALRAAQYALKAIKNHPTSVEDELEWQNNQLPEEIRDLVRNTRKNEKFSV